MSIMPQEPDSKTSHSPRRIQRKRTKGWRMPEGAVSVLLALLLMGCDLGGQDRSDQRYRDCIEAGGSYREPVDDGIGYACDMSGGDAK